MPQARKNQISLIAIPTTTVFPAVCGVRFCVEPINIPGKVLNTDVAG
jgi:hypothetical protein